MDNAQRVETNALAALVDPSAALAAARRLEQSRANTHRHLLFTNERPRSIAVPARPERNEQTWLDA